MLRGKQVILRGLEREDIKRYYELGQNVDLVLFSDGAWMPESLMLWEKSFDKRIESPNDQHNFAIEADGKFIGMIHLHPGANRRAGTGALGIGIYDPEYLGKGYGRDAIETFLDWAFRIQNFRRIKLDTMAHNERALRCYEACGFQREGVLREDDYSDGQYRDVVVMGILRSEWEGRQAAR